MSGAMMGAGMAANFVGSLMQSIAASQAAKNMDEVYGDYLHRNKRYTDQATQTWQQSMPPRQASSALTEIAAGERNRINAYKAANATPLSVNPSGVSGRDVEVSQLQGSNRAALGGYSDWAINQAIRDIRSQQALNQVSNFASGMAGVMPLEMNDAQHSWDELAFHGALMSSLGGGAMAASPFFGQKTPTTLPAQPGNSYNANSAILMGQNVPAAPGPYGAMPLPQQPIQGGWNSAMYDMNRRIV